MRQNARGHPHRDAFGAEHEEQRELAGQGDGLLVAAIVAGDELGDFVVEQLRARELRQPALDVARGGGDVAGEDIAEVSLALDEVALVGQHHQRIIDGRIAVGMVLHGFARDVGDFHEAAVINAMEGPENAALDRLQTVRQVRDGAVADDVGGVIEKAAVHAAMQGQLDLAGNKRTRRRRGGDVLGQDVRFAVAVTVAVLVRGGLGRGRRRLAMGGGGRGGMDFAGGVVRGFRDGKFRLVGILFTFGWHGLKKLACSREPA